MDSRSPQLTPLEKVKEKCVRWWRSSHESRSRQVAIVSAIFAVVALVNIADHPRSDLSALNWELHLFGLLPWVIIAAMIAIGFITFLLVSMILLNTGPCSWLRKEGQAQLLVGSFSKANRSLFVLIVTSLIILLFGPPLVNASGGGHEPFIVILSANLGHSIHRCLRSITVLTSILRHRATEDAEREQQPTE